MTDKLPRIWPSRAATQPVSGSSRTTGMGQERELTIGKPCCEMGWIPVPENDDNGLGSDVNLPVDAE